jgi:hypothetical protein
MHPTYSPALMHQQQQVQQQSQQIPSQQQPQQQLQDPHSSIPNFADNNRLWQQMQQMRSHAADLSSVQPNPQLADLLRNQSMIRLQPGQPHPSPQSFSSGIGMTQIATNQGVSNQQQPFQDLSANQPQPSHMPPVNFNGITNTNVHMNAASQSMQPRNPLLQNFSRPYDLGFTQNQHPQNGAISFSNKQTPSSQPSTQQQVRDQQHMQSNHPSSADIFSSPNLQNEAVRRPSPSHQAIPSQHLQNGMMTSAAVQQNSIHNSSAAQHQLNMFSSRPLPEQAMQLRNAIRTLDNSIAAQKTSDGDHMTKARVHAALVTKKEQMNKLLGNVMAAMQAQSNGGQGQTPWMLQQRPSSSQPPFDPMSLQRSALGVQAPSSLVQSQIQHQSGGTNVNTSSLAQSSQPGQVAGQNALPLQPGASTHTSATGSPFPSQPPASSNPASFNVPSGLVPQLPSQQQQISRTALQPPGMHNPMLQMIPPLDKSRFELAFKNFCNNKQIKIDPRLLSVNNRSIDLHILHTFVMREGGEAKVQQKDLWSIIGGRMGFVQFPGTDTEPAKSGPVIAQQLEHIYRQYLASFDRAYVANVLDSRIKNGPGSLPLNASQFNLMVSMADQTGPQLKSHGFSEHMIQFIDTHRAQLQRMRLERDGFQDTLKPSIGEQSSQAHANNLGVPPMNQAPNFRPPFVQPGPQNNMMQPGGHTVDARQQLTHPTANKPGREQVQAALALITKTTQETMANNANRPSVTIPPEQRMEYNTLLEQIHRQAAEIENKLAMLYIYTRKEDFVRRIIIVTVTVRLQWNMLSSGNPRFFVSLENLRNMHQQMQQAMEMCTQLSTALSQQKLQLQQHQHQHQQQPGARMMNTRNLFALDPSQIRPQSQLQPSPNLQPSQQPANAQQVSLPQMPLHPPPKKKAPAAALQAGPPVTASTPSPAPTSAHTPGPPPAPPTSTPLTTTPSTPALQHSSSPPASRSPKGKIPPKAKQSAAPTPKRRPSKTTPTAIRAESPATPSSNTSIKRPREEDDHVVDVEASSSGHVSNEPSPPKRVKTGWENPPNEELKKRAEEVTAESSEDASSFFEQMSELFKKATDNGEQESTLSADLSEALHMLLGGCASVPEASDNPLVFGDSVTGRESPPASAGFKDAFEEFIDYSFGQDNQIDDEEEGSKAQTPELVSSSTNLSPESNADGENSLLATIATSVSDVKKEDHQDLRLGLWKEFDGGESAYHQPFEWKWDSPMPVLEQSWAVSTS